MKHYKYNGTEFTTPPDPFLGRSPMHKADGSYNDDAFREMGGTTYQTINGGVAGTCKQINRDGTLVTE